MTERNFLQRCCRGLVNVIVLVSLAWFLVFGFFTQLSMSGHSMEPCLYSGDTVMLDTLSYHFSPRDGWMWWPFSGLTAMLR